MAKKETRVIDVGGFEVTITSPSKVYFPKTGYTKWDLVDYYLAVGAGAVRGVYRRPVVLKRFVKGAAGEAFFQKRAPSGRPEWVETITLTFPSGHTAEEVAVFHLAQLLWCTNLGCIDLNPHAIRVDDLEHPDELRIDLDPQPDIPWTQIRDVAFVAREVLVEHGLEAWPKTSGSRGIHILSRIHPRWGFDDVRRAALAVGREVERRVPALATTKWWKEERHGVFLDYNQNAKDRTVASAYSVRPTEDARVSAPLTWDELKDADPADFNLRTVPARFAEIGDPHAAIDDHAAGLEALLALADKQQAEGHEDAPWPPHFRKKSKEPRRAPPSKRRDDEP